MRKSEVLKKIYLLFIESIVVERFGCKQSGGLRSQEWIRSVRRAHFVSRVLDPDGFFEISSYSDPGPGCFGQIRIRFSKLGRLRIRSEHLDLKSIQILTFLAVYTILKYQLY